MGQKERALGDVHVAIFRFSFGGVAAEVQTLFSVMFLPLVECLGELIADVTRRTACPCSGNVCIFHP